MDGVGEDEKGTKQKRMRPSRTVGTNVPDKGDQSERKETGEKTSPKKETKRQVERLSLMVLNTQGAPGAWKALEALCQDYGGKEDKKQFGNIL